MAAPKKQHYLPRFYLSGFSREGKLWVHHRERDTYEQRNPKTLATRKHYYSVVNEKGEKDPTIEHVLGMVENTAAQIITKLDAGEKIDYWDKIHLAQFVALMKFRVPAFERWFADFSEATLKQKMKDDFPSVEAIQRKLEEQGKDDPADTEQARGIFEGLGSKVPHNPKFISSDRSYAHGHPRNFAPAHAHGVDLCRSTAEDLVCNLRRSRACLGLWPAA